MTTTIKTSFLIILLLIYSLFGCSEYKNNQDYNNLFVQGTLHSIEQLTENIWKVSIDRNDKNPVWGSSFSFFYADDKALLEGVVIGQKYKINVRESDAYHAITLYVIAPPNEEIIYRRIKNGENYLTVWKEESNRMRDINSCYGLTGIRMTMIKSMERLTEFTNEEHTYQQNPL